MADNGRFQINDIELNIPPEQIHIEKMSFNNVFQTLRTTSSTKVKSGFSNIQISMNVSFTENNQGLLKLRYLIAQFRVTPFCYVENEFLRNSILGSDSTNNMALALEQMEIVKGAGGADVINVFFKFLWFNYLPYSPNFTFKEDIFFSKEVKDPRKSNAWRLMYQAELNRMDRATTSGSGSYDSISSIKGSNVTFSFTQYAISSIERYSVLSKEFDALKNLKKKLMERKVGATGDGNTDHVIYSNLVESLGGDKVHARRLMEEVFGNSTSIGQENNNIDSTIDRMVNILKGYTSKNTTSKYSLIADKERWKIVGTKKGNAIRLGSSLEEEISQISKIGKKESIVLFRERFLSTDNSNIVVTKISISYKNVLAVMPVVGHPYPTFQHIGSQDFEVLIDMVTTNEEALQNVSNFYTMIETQAHQGKLVPQGYRNLHIVNNDLLGLLGLRDFLPNALVTDTVPGSPGTYSMSLQLLNNPLTPEVQESLTAGQSFVTTQDIRRLIANIIVKNLLFKRSWADKKIVTLFGDREDVSIRGSDLTGRFDTLSDPSIKQLMEASSGRFSAYQYTGPQTSDRNAAFSRICETYGFLMGETISTIASVIANTSLTRNATDFYSTIGLLTANTQKESELRQEKYNTIAETRMRSFWSLDDNEVLSIERMQDDLRKLVEKQERYKTWGSFQSKDLAVIRNLSKIYFTNPLKYARALANASNSNKEKTKLQLELTEAQSRANYLLDEREYFKQKYLGKWMRRSAELIDRYILATGLVYELDEFAPVRNALRNLAQTSKVNAYPDFPLQEVINIINSSDDPSSILIKRKFDQIVEEQQLSLVNMGPSSLLQPDFYFFNRAEASYPDKLIPYDAIKKASDSILESYGNQRIDAEKDWFQNYADIKMGNQKLSKMRQSLQNVRGYTDKRNVYLESPTAHAEQLKAVIQKEIAGSISTPLWESDYDANEGKFGISNGLGCALAEGEKLASQDQGKEENEQIYTPITVRPINANEDTYNFTSSERAQEEMSPPSNWSEAQHRFGTDSIKFLSELAYRPQPKPEPDKDPFFIWPCSRQAQRVTSKFSYKRVRPHLVNEALEKAKKDKKELTREQAKALILSEHGNDPEWVKPHLGIDIAGTKGPEDSNGAEVLASAAGKVLRVRNSAITDTGMCYIVIQHANNWTTKYMHLERGGLAHEMKMRLDSGITDVPSGWPIGTIGNTGTNSTGKHLHFETWKDGIAVDPLSVLDGRFHPSYGPLASMDPRNENILTKCTEQLEKDLRNGQGDSMRRAYPTFRLYFVESDAGERRRYFYDDFFAYSSIKDIQVIKNRKIASDLCIIQLTNISGTLSNRKFRNLEDEVTDPLSITKPRTALGKKVKEKNGKGDLIDENPIAAMMLQPGVQIHLRLGYSSNPEDLEKVFNGVIADIEFNDTDDLITIVCQSFGYELVQNTYSEDKKYGGWLSKGGRTAKLLEELMASPEVVHFGRWERDYGSNQSFRNLLTKRWTFRPQPQDDNIFAPQGRGLLRGLFDSTLYYHLFHTTIWDVFQEMCLRHPGYIAYPVPYTADWGEERMTMFFGLPDQLYFARDPTIRERETQVELKKAIKEAKEKASKNDEKIREILADPAIYYTQYTDLLLLSIDDNAEVREQVAEEMINSLELQLAKDKGIIKSYRNYHIITSDKHIMHNNIISSGYKTFNVTTVQYGNDYAVADEVKQELSFGTFKDPDTLTIEVDTNLPDEEKKELFAQHPNCVGYEMAKRYCIGYLFNTMKEGYHGSITIIGNPRIKPLDIVYIFDSYSDMYGQVEVEQVVHKFSQQTGFVTEITPNMVVHVNQHSTMSTADAMGLIAEVGMQKIGMKQSTAEFLWEANEWNPLVLAFSPISNMFFNTSEHTAGQGTTNDPLKMLGAFIFRKFITRTQTAQPLRYSPLVHNGKPMLGGIPSRKTAGGFFQAIERWFKSAERNTPLFLEDWYDKLHVSQWYPGNIFKDSKGEFDWWGNAE